MATNQTEGVHAGEFILSEVDPEISREVVTLASGQDLAAGAVLGQKTADGEYAEHDPAAGDGTETAVAILYDSEDTVDGAAKVTVVARLAAVVESQLSWIDGIATADKDDAITALANNFIITR